MSSLQATTVDASPVHAVDGPDRFIAEGPVTQADVDKVLQALPAELPHGRPCAAELVASTTTTHDPHSTDFGAAGVCPNPALTLQVALVTPKVAFAWLSHNGGADSRNRTIRVGEVRKYAALISAGQWHLSHQGIAFAKPCGDTVRLIDGQHRLLAIILSGQAVWTTIAFDVDQNVFTVVDTQAKRTGKDTLTIAGVQDAAVLATAFRYLNTLTENPEDQTWNGAQAVLSNQDVLELWESSKNPDSPFHGLDRAAEIAVDIRSIGMISSAAAVAIHLTRRANPDLPQSTWDEWFNGLLTGVNLPPADPRLLLRVRLMGSRTNMRRGQRATARTQVALYVKSWNAWATGMPVSQLKFVPSSSANKRGDTFPAALRVMDPKSHLELTSAT